MKKALFSVLLATAIVAGAAMAPALADDISKDRVTKSDKIAKMNHKGKVKSSHLEKSKEDESVVKNKTIQEDDYYTSAREQQIKTSM